VYKAAEWLVPTPDSSKGAPSFEDSKPNHCSFLFFLDFS